MIPKKLYNPPYDSNISMWSLGFLNFETTLCGIESLTKSVFCISTVPGQVDLAND